MGTKSFSPRKSATKTHTYEYPFANVCAQVARETNYLPVCESTSIFKCRSNHARKQKEQRHHNVFVCLESLALKRVCVFYSLLFLALLEVLLWSVVLVPGDANSVWNLSAQQYYQRETGNLKSFQQQPRFQIQVRVLDLYLESLAHKQEHLWRKEEFNLYDKNLQPLHPEPPDKRTGIGLSLSSLGRCLLEEVVSSKFSKSTAIGERVSNYNLNVRV